MNGQTCQAAPSISLFIKFKIRFDENHMVGHTNVYSSKILDFFFFALQNACR